MKPIAELLRYLSHPAITEIALTTGRCPMIKSINGYEPVDSAVLTDEELNRTLLTMVGPARAASVTEKPMKWSVRAEGVATLAVVAVRRSEGLSIRVMRTGDASAAAGKPSETPVPTAAGAASASPEPGPAEAPAASAPPGARDIVPPTVAPLVPPVKRPSVAGLRVIKASSAAPAQEPSPTASVTAPPARTFPATPAPIPPPIPEAVAPAPPQPLPPPVSEEAMPPPPPVQVLPPPVSKEIFTPPLGHAVLSPASVEKALPPPPVPTPFLGIPSEPPPPSPREDSSIEISIQEPEERTRPLSIRPELPPRARPDFWRDLPALMEEARRIGASDLHIVSGRPALFRVAGELKPDGEALPPKRVEQMVLSQLPARLRAAFDRDGSCDFALQLEGAGRFRVNVCRQRTGLKGSFRLIARELPSLEALGLPTDLILATRPSHGLIFITGPSGHGKTSTLTALVDVLNRETRRHIVTVEDPVEFVHPRKRGLISQREVGTHTRSVASAMRAAMREDADVIVVGELRDAESVRLALAASEAGHLVLGTMNTPGAAKTIERIIDSFPPAAQAQARQTLAAHLRLIVSQRLVPVPAGTSLVAAAELLPSSVALSQLIRESKLSQLAALMQRGREQGMVRLDDALADIVRSQKTTLEIAKGFAENADMLEVLVTGSAPELPPEPGSGGARLASPAGAMLGRKSA
jgi:twitching motility protein PilT